jgi:hypothetical protein
MSREVVVLRLCSAGPSSQKNERVGGARWVPSPKSGLIILDPSTGKNLTDPAELFENRSEFKLIARRVAKYFGYLLCPPKNMKFDFRGEYYRGVGDFFGGASNGDREMYNKQLDTIPRSWTKDGTANLALDAGWWFATRHCREAASIRVA